MVNRDVPNKSVDVLLVSMPFGPILQPSIGLSLLKATVERSFDSHVSTKVLYLTISFAKLIGEPLYQKISLGQPMTYDLVGEWLFAKGLFNLTEASIKSYINDIVRGGVVAHRAESEAGKKVSEKFVGEILDVQSKISVFLEQCLVEVLRHQPKIVGFTSTFQQHVASLALAKRIKAQAPNIFIVFGGANCEGIMGVESVRQFPFIDAIVSGEGDLVFPELVQRALADKTCDDMLGVYTARNIDLMLTDLPLNAPSVRNMDALPFPDYSDFFEQIEKHALSVPKNSIRLMFETSRGCWWGEKNHCTFCGLNGSTMMYRSKSSERALAELTYLTKKYPSYAVSVVDNILDMKYFKDFLPELAERQLGVELFYEVKSNLKKEQLRLMRDAGITMIQPGIESLSTDVLKLMRKGVKGIQNIQLLKWCKELGVKAYWNVLCGFPGESPEEYQGMAELVPFLSHLPPPESWGIIRLDRFSPNFDKANQLGFKDVLPYPAYYYIYPFNPSIVANLAYFFTFQYQENQDVVSYTAPLAKQIIDWQNSYQESDLFWVDKKSGLLIWDLRPISQEHLVFLTGWQRILYMACDVARSAKQLGRIVAQHKEPSIPQEKIQKILDHFVKRGLMVCEGNSYLSLAIPLGKYYPSRQIFERLKEITKEF
ncbi:MAG: RiPP maturation radical SAM C-methyltransferase [Ardenticatenaceae bacterium]